MAEMDQDSLFSILTADVLLRKQTDSAFADSARRGGEHLVCHAGCTACCHGAFAISPLDALRLRWGMEELSAKDTERAAAVKARAARYRDQYAGSFPGNATTGLLDPERAEEFAAFANDAACPALDPRSGLCDLYDARPMTCRVFGPPVRQGTDDGEEGFAVCELCFTEASAEEIAAAEMHPPFDDEAELQETLLQATEGGKPEAGGETIVAWCLLEQNG